MCGLESPLPDGADDISGNPNRRELKCERYALLINRELHRRMIDQVVFEFRRILRLSMDLYYRQLGLLREETDTEQQYRGWEPDSCKMILAKTASVRNI